jgi:hypothetical protein
MTMNNTKRAEAVATSTALIAWMRANVPDELLWKFPKNFSLSVTEYTYDDETNTSAVDVEATQRNLATWLMILGPGTVKDYSDDYFSLEKKFDDGFTVRITADRKSVCKAKVVGQKWQPGYEGRMVDVVEYECEPIALSKIEV